LLTTNSSASSDAVHNPNMPIAGSVVIRERRARYASRAMW